MVVELRRQMSGEGDVRLERLGHAIRTAFCGDRRLYGVECGQFRISSGTEPDPTQADII